MSNIDLPLAKLADMRSQSNSDTSAEIGVNLISRASNNATGPILTIMESAVISRDTGFPKCLVLSESNYETGVDLKIFHLFPKLPPELRVKIWHAAFSELRPRVVEVLWSKTLGLCTDCPVPIYLHVNSESRAEALKIYKRFRGTFDPITSHKGEVQEPYFYVNYEKDRLYFSSLRRSAGEEKDLSMCNEHIGSELLGPSISSPIRVWAYIHRVMIRSGSEHIKHIAVCLRLHRFQLRMCKKAIGFCHKLETFSSVIDLDSEKPRRRVSSMKLLDTDFLARFLKSRNEDPTPTMLAGAEAEVKIRCDEEKSSVKHAMIKGGADHSMVDKLQLSVCFFERPDVEH